jgi:hypothetical protein
MKKGITLIIVSLIVIGYNLTIEAQEEGTPVKDCARASKASPVGPAPEFMYGLYTNEDGDLVFRSITDGDFSIDYCYREIERFAKGKINPDFPVGPILPVVGAAVAAFQIDSLTHALIDVPTNDYYLNLRAKMSAISNLDPSTLNDEYRHRVEQYAIEAVVSKDQWTRVSAATILTKLGMYDQVYPMIMEMKDLTWVKLLNNYSKYTPIILSIATDSTINPYTRMSAAYAYQGMTNELGILNRTSIQIIMNIDPKTADADYIRGYWLAARWVERLNDPQIVIGLQQMAFSDELFLADQAVTSLAHLANRGDIEAENALYYILENHPNPTIRSQAGQLIP